MSESPQPSGEDNPYAPPKTEASPRTKFEDFAVEGETLVCGTGLRLPRRCIRTNEELPRSMDSLTRHRTVLFRSFTLPGDASSCWLEYSLSVAERRKQTVLRFVGWLIILGGLVMAPMITHLVIFTILLGCVAIYFAVPVRVFGYRNGRFRLTGFSKAFLASLASDAESKQVLKDQD